MSYRRFIYDPSSAKYICPDPDCGKKTFVRSIDIETGELLPEQYGRCDREINCGYKLSPYDDGYVKSMADLNVKTSQFRRPQTSLADNSLNRKPVLIDDKVLQKTIANGYEKNVFIQNLIKNVPYPFDQDDVYKVAEAYRLGTILSGDNGYMDGGITFPFIDEKGGCRAIQVKAFDKNNHTLGNADSLISMMEKHHNKKGTPIPGWIEAYQKQSLKFSSFFGAHLLPEYSQNPIALCEAPKGAVYGALHYDLPKSPDDILWLAVYNVSSLTIERCKAIAGRTVYLFPDLSRDRKAFNKWTKQANWIMEALPGTRMVMSDHLEKDSGFWDRENGLDIADYLIQYDWRRFRNHKTQKLQPQTLPTPEPITRPEPSPIEKPYIPPQNFNTGSWDKEIEQIDKFFEPVEELNIPIKLNGIIPVDNIKGFLQANLEVAKAQNGNPTYLPYLNRVKDLMKHLEGIKNNSPIHN